jgi:hypothetical protein
MNISSFYSKHQHVSITRVTIFRVAKTRIQPKLYCIILYYVVSYHVTLHYIIINIPSYIQEHFLVFLKQYIFDQRAEQGTYNTLHFYTIAV